MKVSYLITTFQRADALEQHFKQLEKQTVKPDEVLICDDGSTDNTKEISLKNNARYLNTGKTETFNASESRNNGIKNAKGEILIMVDVDCLPHPKLIENYIKNFDEYIIQIGYRSSKKEYLDIKLPCPVEDGKMQLYALEELKTKYLKAGMFTSGNSCMHIDAARTLTKQGNIGYDERFTGYGYEDSEFGIRLEQNGYLFTWNKDAIIYHMNPSSTFQIDPKRKEMERIKNRELLNKIINE